jgi:hypothetical protein
MNPCPNTSSSRQLPAKQAAVWYAHPACITYAQQRPPTGCNQLTMLLLRWPTTPVSVCRQSQEQQEQLQVLSRYLVKLGVLQGLALPLIVAEIVQGG